MAIEFQKGNSLLHQLDARTKLLMFVGLTVVAIVIIDPLIIALLFLALYAFGLRAVDNEMLNRNLRVLVVIFSTFAIFQILFFTPRDAHFLFYLIPGREWVPVTIEGLIRGVAVFFRFFIVVLSVHLMLYTTPPVNLVLGLTRRQRRRRSLHTVAGTLILGCIFFAIANLRYSDRVMAAELDPGIRTLILALGAIVVGYVTLRVATAGLPPEMGLALTLGFATVGILSQQTQRITDAQKARGYDVTPKNLLKRVRVLTALMLPIFLATLERSQEIAIAILARAFDYNISNRTYRRELRFQVRDFVVMGIIVGLLLGGLALDAAGFGNPTEQWILKLVES